MQSDLKLRVILDLVEKVTQPLKNLVRGNTALMQSFKATQTRLKELGKVQKEVAAFRQLQTSLRDTATALGAARQRVDTLKASIKASDTPTAALIRKFAQASSAVHQLGTEYQQQSARIEALGLGKAITTEAQVFARNLKTAGTSITENLEFMHDAMSIFGDVHHAKLVLPTIAKMKFANQAMYGDEEGAAHDASLMSMMKVIELRRGLANAQRFEEEADRV